MTQEERWLARYKEVKTFIEANQRNPSRHRIEEYDMLNWLKANRKLLNAGAMKIDRIVSFKELLSKIEEYNRGNQWGGMVSIKHGFLRSGFAKLKVAYYYK